MPNFLFSTAAGALFAAASLVPAFAAEEVKNVVLVHGAFVDETSWQPVADILTKRGFKVTLVKNPLTSLKADVDATRSAIAAQSGKTILVGHSWGGVVISQAGDDPKVSALVYVSAFGPDVGESVAALGKNGTATEGVKAIRPDSRGYLTIDPAAFVSSVAADVPVKIAEVLANNQLPLNHTAFEDVVTTAAWHDKPSFYVVSARDKLIDPTDQRFFAKRMKAETVEVDGSHASLVVHAKEVADVIEKAAHAK